MTTETTTGRTTAQGSPASPAAPVTVELHGLDLGYDGRTAVLTGVEGTLHAGEALALIGPNGSGKSTLLKGLLGLTRPVRGTVRVLGRRPADARRDVGYLPQTAEVDPTFPVTVRQVVAMGRYRRETDRPLGWLRPASAADRRAVTDALERVGLADRARRRFGELSGGQRQRVLLARALAGDPGLLLLDEPFNGLDETNRDALEHILAELAAGGMSIVLSTHDIGLARAVCTHAAVLAGRQLAFGPIAQALAPAVITAAYSGRSDVAAVYAAPFRDAPVAEAPGGPVADDTPASRRGSTR